MGIDLTYEKRTALWQQLTKLQQETLQHEKKYRLQSLFLTENFLLNNHWEFFDFKENPLYPHGDTQRLFCRCGRELKYQFILISKETGETLALGSTHFAQHLSVEPQIAKEIQSGLQQINRSVDLILTSIERGLTFPKRYYNLFISNGLQQKVPASFFKRLAAFKAAELPLYESDLEQLTAVLKKAGISLVPLPDQRQRTAQVNDDNYFKTLIYKLTAVEIGEVVDVEQLCQELPISKNSLNRWFGLLTAATFPVQLKQVGTSFYRIK